MSEQRRHVLVLTGPLTGHTGRLNGYKFENGRCVLLGTDEGVAPVKLYFSRTYRAYPEGSEELRQAQEADAAREAAAKEEAADGERDAQDSQHDPSQGEGDGDVRPDGQGPAPAPAGDGGGDADPAAGTEGGVSGGDGHGDPGIPPKEPAPKQPDDPQQGAVSPNPKLRKAVDSLDPSNDDHWTNAGLPKIAVVDEAYGEGSVTRREIEAVAPGYTRETAKAKADEAALKDLA